MRLLGGILSVVALLVLVSPAARAQSEAQQPTSAPQAQSLPSPTPDAPTRACMDLSDSVMDILASHSTQKQYILLNASSNIKKYVDCAILMETKTDAFAPYFFQTAGEGYRADSPFTQQQQAGLVGYIAYLGDEDTFDKIDAEIFSVEAIKKIDDYNNLVTKYNTLSDQYNELLRDDIEETSELRAVIAEAAAASTPTRISPLQDLLNTIQRIANRPQEKHITCESDSSGDIMAFGSDMYGTSGTTTTNCTEQ
jgi:hypothetical protein